MPSLVPDLAGDYQIGLVVVDALGIPGAPAAPVTNHRHRLRQRREHRPQRDHTPAATPEIGQTISLSADVTDQNDAAPAVSRRCRRSISAGA